MINQPGGGGGGGDGMINQIPVVVCLVAILCQDLPT